MLSKIKGIKRKTLKKANSESGETIIMEQVASPNDQIISFILLHGYM